VTRNLITTKKRIETVAGYNEILRDIRSLLEKATYQAYKIVDNLRVQTYWQVGERIARGELEHKERADYGEKVVERLTIDLKMQKSTLYDMSQFYKTYPILHAVRGELSWTHYRILMRVSNANEREFYEVQTIQNTWSTRGLESQIKSNLYQRILKEGKLSIIQPLPYYYRENRMYPWEKSPVGLIICEYKGKEEVHYALGGLENKIFVAEYKAKLPSEDEIGRGLKNIRSAR